MIDLTFEEVACWVPEAITDPVEFENWIGNKIYGIEVTDNPVWEKALKIAAIRKMGPPFAEASWGKDVEIYLNGVQPVGIMQVDNLGTVICPSGKAAEVVVNKIKIPKDELFVIKSGKDQTEKLKISLKGNLKIEKKNNFTVDVTGGEVGIIIDTRGRPFLPPEISATGRERLIKWQKALQK